MDWLTLSCISVCLISSIFSLLNPRYKCHIRCPVPFLPCGVVGFDLFGFGIVLAYFLGRQIHAVFVKYLQVLFRVCNMAVDKVGVNLLYLLEEKARS